MIAVVYDILALDRDIKQFAIDTYSVTVIKFPVMLRPTDIKTHFITL